MVLKGKWSRTLPRTLTKLILLQPCKLTDFWLGGPKVFLTRVQPFGTDIYRERILVFVSSILWMEMKDICHLQGFKPGQLGQNWEKEMMQYIVLNCLLPFLNMARFTLWEECLCILSTRHGHTAPEHCEIIYKLECTGLGGNWLHIHGHKKLSVLLRRLPRWSLTENGLWRRESIQDCCSLLICEVVRSNCVKQTPPKRGEASRDLWVLVLVSTQGFTFPVTLPEGKEVNPWLC